MKKKKQKQGKKKTLRRKGAKRNILTTQKQTQVEQEEFLTAEAPNGFFPRTRRKSEF